MTPKLTLKSRSFIFLIYLAFFASGAACLMAEVTWNRMLIVVVGNSVSATAMILVVFMGGLALGSQLGGRFFGKRIASLVPYLLLELAIGVYVILSPFLFDLLSGLFTSLAESGGDRGPLTMIRIAVTLTALLVPAFLMGATFPAMVAGSALESSSRRTARTGYLYSINTLGAAVGCFVGGFEFLFGFGVQVTLACAFGLYLLAALCALVAHTLARSDLTEAGREAGRSLEQGPGKTAKKNKAKRPLAEPMPARASASASPRTRTFLYCATFGIGFVALAYEVLLTRLGILYFGNTLSIFPLVLTGFLLGTGISAVLGTWLYGVLRRHTHHGDRLFGYVALAAGALVLATPYLLLTDWVIGSDPFARLADATSRDPLPILAIIIAPTVLIGALLPLAIRMLEPEVRADATREAATLYALNSAGGLLGSGLINHYVVPVLGTRDAFIGLATICATVGVVSLLAPTASRRQGSLAAAGMAAMALLLALTLPSIADLHAGKIAESTHARVTEVKLVREGRAATVTVLDQQDPQKGTHRDLYLNGVEEASTRYWHTQLFKLLGMFPVLVHEPEKPKEVLVIAFGAGITAGSVLASDQVASLDTVDLNPDVEGINNLFADVNGDVFHNPRFHFHNDDGRNYLVTSRKRYDVIISDSTHPRAYDSWVLYTEEFYRSVQRRLLPGGVFAQWVPVAGSMQGDLFRIHLNTFRQVFPEATLWYVYGSDQALLLATPKPFRLDVARLQQRLDRLPTWFRAQEYQLDTAARIAGFFWMDRRMMARIIGDETRINTDHLHHFDKQSALRPLGPELQLPKFHSRVVPFLDGGNAALSAAVRDEQIVAHLLADYAFYGRQGDLFGAYCFMPQNGNARYWMSRELSGKLPDQDTFCSPERQ
jgi:spermidine synthase